MEHSKAAPVVRQLDFTVNYKSTANGNAIASVNLILPEHPQSHLQSKLLALAQPHARPREMPTSLQSPPVAPRLAHPVKTVTMPKAALQPFPKTESPKTRERSNLEQNDATPKKQKQCNCRNSRCLKLYCECFAAGIYCDECNCINCHNKAEYEADRKVAIDAVLERNPLAFKPKIAISPHGAIDGGIEHNKGCNCKKSGCLKKYCECFQANILCSDKCKCIDCKNFEGSEERNFHYHVHRENSLALVQHATNAAIGTPRKKSRNQEPVLTSDVSYSPLSIHLSKPDAAKLGRKSPYRRCILHLQDVKDLCKALVEVSAKASKTFSEEIKPIDTNLSEAEISVTSEDGKDRDGISSYPCESNGCDVQSRRPLSPRTLALMCDEQDTTFITTNSPFSIPQCNNRTTMKSKWTNGLDPLYIEQERLVLTTFRNFLNGLIPCGSIEETKIEQEPDKDLCGARWLQMCNRYI